MKSRIILLLIIFFLSFQGSFASHAWGGDISWRCLSNGQFVFKLNFYRDCGGIPCMPSASLNVINHPTINSILLTPVFPVSYQNPNGCNGCVISPSPATALELCIYESAPVTIAGTPPDSGWVFEWGSCCRSGVLSNIMSPGSYSYTYSSIMYPYNMNNTNPAFDSSPHFLTAPQTTVCSGLPTKISFATHDPDGDSLVYSLVPIPGMPYVPGYSGASPLPGPVQNPSNSAADLNPQTGELSFMSFTTGVFLTYVKVESYRCGIKIAEVFRDYSISIVNTSDCLLPGGLANNPPMLTPPFQNSAGQITQFSDTLLVGDSIQFDITISDTDNVAPGLPYVLLDVKSIVLFDSIIAPGANCALPPCAIINPSVPLGPTAFSSTTSINWVTDCAHLMTKDSCFDLTRQLDFELIYQDDYCPVPGYAGKIISILVKDLKPAATPRLDSISILPNGDVNLYWTTPTDPNNVFNAFYIYFANDSLGPYSLIDSITNFNQTTYTHIGANGNTVPVYYQMTSKSGILCQSNYESPSSNRLSNSAIFSGTSIPDPGPKIQIYPIPANSILTIESNLFLQNNVTVEIRNLLGQLLYIDKPVKSHQQFIDLSNFESGIYVISFHSLNARTIYKRILKN